MNIDKNQAGAWMDIQPASMRVQSSAENLFLSMYGSTCLELRVTYIRDISELLWIYE